MKTNTEPTKIGIIGCGKISNIYLKNLTDGKWPEVKVIACADLLIERARAASERYPDIQAQTVTELLENDEVELVLSLTIPQVHYKVALEVIRVGKHHYSEKPFTLSTHEAQHLLVEAEKRNVALGCAPDTFMGAGIQTARQAIDQGVIGKPVSVIAQMMCRGHEGWHPDPEFYYKPGGGPLFDMGPYYLAAMVALLGPVTQVMGVECTTFPEREIRSEPKKGQKIKVEVPTHHTAILVFSAGAIGSLITSFDCEKPQLPPITISGTEGCLHVPDPNTFGGDVTLIKNKETQVLPHIHPFDRNERGLGVVEMAVALRRNTLHRANGLLAVHLVEIMEAVHKSSTGGKAIPISPVDQPQPYKGTW